MSDTVVVTVPPYEFTFKLIVYHKAQVQKLHIGIWSCGMLKVLDLQGYMNTLRVDIAGRIVTNMET